MKKRMNLSTKKSIEEIGKSLTDRQKEVVRLLQKKEKFITDKKKVVITCGKNTKKVTPHTFYNLVNKGLVQQNGQPFNYVLSATGSKIKI